MYSPIVIASHLEPFGKKVTRRTVDEVVGQKAVLMALINDKKGLKRPLSDGEKEFITSERILCKYDFRYWAERYAHISRDPIAGGGVGLPEFWTSQDVALNVIGKIEEETAEALKRKEQVWGVRVLFHKARQLGATMLGRMLAFHRLLLWSTTRSMAASGDDKQVMELYDRDLRILENLPWYLIPSIGFHEKAQHIYFDKLDSRLLYQQANQQTGLGQGRQFDIAHLTEVAFWPQPQHIQFDFFPTLPRGPFTLCMLESTANGRGNWWHEFSEDVRNGMHLGWRYIFTPWYIERKKNRATPPEGWNPTETSLAHAKKVYETSAEFVGESIYLDKEQLYWYECERYSAVKMGSLNLFLTNYCATPSESFQHTTTSQFSPELLDILRMNASWGKPYEVMIKL